jgi:hypothetical protein
MNYTIYWIIYQKFSVVVLLCKYSLGTFYYLETFPVHYCFKEYSSHLAYLEAWSCYPHGSGNFILVFIHSWWCCGWPDLGHGTPKLQVYIVKIEVFLSRLIVCNPSPQNKSHPLGDRRHGIYLLMLHWHVVRLIGTWRRPLLLILRPA